MTDDEFTLDEYAEMDREASLACSEPPADLPRDARREVLYVFGRFNKSNPYHVAILAARDRILARRRTDKPCDYEAAARAIVGALADATAVRMVAALLRDLAESQRANREAAEVLREVGTERALEAAEKCEACGEMSDRTAESTGAK